MNYTWWNTAPFIKQVRADMVNVTDETRWVYKTNTKLNALHVVKQWQMKSDPFTKQIHTKYINGLRVVKQQKMKTDPFIKQTQANLNDLHVVKQ